MNQQAKPGSILMLVNHTRGKHVENNGIIATAVSRYEYSTRYGWILKDPSRPIWCHNSLKGLQLCTDDIFVADGRYIVIADPSIDINEHTEKERENETK